MGPVTLGAAARDFYNSAAAIFEARVGQSKSVHTLAAEQRRLLDDLRCLTPTIM